MAKGLLLVVLALASVAGAPARVTVRDIDGRVWTPLAPADGKINLLFFIAADCPVSNRYAPEIDRIVAAYGPRGVQPFLVYAVPRIEPARVRENLRDFHPGVRTPAIIDSDFSLTAAVGATVTPEAVVVAKNGRAYRGRIDDLYLNTGQTRRAAQQHDLRDALDAVLAGRPPAQSETRAVGCFIERTIP